MVANEKMAFTMSLQYRNYLSDSSNLRPVAFNFRILQSQENITAAFVSLLNDFLTHHIAVGAAVALVGLGAYRIYAARKSASG